MRAAKLIPGCVFTLVAGLFALGVWSAFDERRGGLADDDDYEVSLPAPAKGDLTLVLILDTSGSMSAKVEGTGQTRMEIAKGVLLESFVPLLDDRAWLGLVVFDGRGGKVLLEPRPAETKLEAKWTQRERIMEEIEEASPDAMTPIWASLTGTREQLLAGREGRRVVVLITDGSESVRTPADVVAAIDENDEAGIETYVIGFELGHEGRYLQDRLGLGKRYFQANKGREGLMAALSSVLAAIEE